MKLPEYDNRPPAGTPLYTDPRDSGWDDIKFPLLLVGLTLGVIASVVFFFTGIADLLRDLFN